METLWYCLVAIMIAGYVVLDGFDLGAGIVHHFVARDERERRLVLRSIGPVWDGNEVWLVAASGTLFFAFPSLYASSFSGFYLPLMLVLWLLILRGISIEFRNHIDSRVWKPFWDVSFTLSSALLAFFFGAALGNVIRGVPLDSSRTFFLPLWTDFRLGFELGILDWYTVMVGLLAFLTLAQHGALWVALKTEAAVQGRARAAAGTAWFGVVAMTVLVTILTMRVQPQVAGNLADHRWGYAFPSLALLGLLMILARGQGRADRTRFLGSCAFIVGMLASAAFGVYPYLLPGRPDPSAGLTVHNAATGPYGLWVGLAWWIPGMILALGYFVFTYRRFAGKVRLGEEGY